MSGINQAGGEQTPERIAEIRKRVKKATAGPWTVAPRSDTDETANVVANYERLADGKEQAHWIAELDAQIDFGVDEEEHFQTLEGNAEFIAHAREDVPFLLSQLDALTATLAHLTQEREETRERHTIQLAAISTATLSNTHESAAKWNTLDRDNPYWTAAYMDVCTAIQREIRWRERAEQAEATLARVKAQEQERFFLDTDQDSHWFLVPVAHREEWNEWCDLDQEDPRAWEAPSWAKPLGTGPQVIEFLLDAALVDPPVSSSTEQTTKA